MAKIWPAYEGREPTIGEPWADLPLTEAIALLGLRPKHFRSDLSAPPRFGEADRNLWYAGFKHIVVEVEATEANREGWKPGFYLSPVKPKEASRKLLSHFLTPALGKDNVVRFALEPTIDSEGRSTHRITVVITPDAVQHISGEAAMSAISTLRENLGGMIGDGTPIVEYATEAELAADASP